MSEFVRDNIKEVAFSYNQDLSHAFKTNSCSGLPPVSELFGGFIGSYRYSSKSSPLCVMEDGAHLKSVHKRKD